MSVSHKSKNYIKNIDSNKKTIKKSIKKTITKTLKNTKKYINKSIKLSKNTLNNNIKKIIKKNIDTAYYLEFPIPKKIYLNKDDNLNIKILNIKNKMRVKTYCNNSKMKKIENIENVNLLKDFLVFNSIWDKKTLNKKYNNLIELDNTKDKYNIPYNIYKNEGLTFYLSIKNNQCMYDMLQILKKYYKYLYINIDLLLKSLLSCNNEKISNKEYDNILKKYIKFFIIKYDPNTGIELHLDNVNRTKGGIIITVSIGPEEIFYDMVPLSKDINKNAYRIPIKDGEIVVMDGKSRFLYCHALPYNCKFNKTKFTFGFLFEPFDKFFTGKYYDTFFKHYLPKKSNFETCHNENIS